MSSGDDHQMDIDVDDPELQRNRQEESELSLMGNLSISDLTGDSLSNEKILSPLTPEMVQALYSEDVTLQLEGAQKIGKLLSGASNLPIEQVIQSGAVPRFVHFLKNFRYPALQFESASVLTNITGGNSAQTQVVIDSGAIPVLIRLISSSKKNVVEQSVWALGNIAFDSNESRDLILNSNVLPPLLGLFNDNASLSLRRIATWTLRTLCRGNNPLPNFEQVSQCLPVLSREISSLDAEILVNVCCALACLSKGPNEQIQVVIESGVCYNAVKLLSHTSSDLVLAALCLVGNIASGNHWQTQVLIDKNVLPALGSLLFHEKVSIVKEASWTLSNITAGTKPQIQAVIEAALLPPLIVFLHHPEVSVRKEAAWAIQNATANGSEEQIAYIVAAGANVSLCKLLTETPDPHLIDGALEGRQENSCSRPFSQRYRECFLNYRTARC